MNNICFIIPKGYPIIAEKGFPKFGGSEVKQIILAIALRDRGYNVFIITDDYGQEEFSKHKGLHIIKLCPKIITLIKGKFYWQLYYFWRAIRLSKCDIIFQRAAGPITGVIALFCKLQRKKFIYFVASSQDVDKKYIKNTTLRILILHN